MLEGEETHLVVRLSEAEDGGDGDGDGDEVGAGKAPSSPEQRSDRGRASPPKKLAPIPVASEQPVAAQFVPPIGEVTEGVKGMSLCDPDEDDDISCGHPTTATATTTTTDDDSSAPETPNAYRRCETCHLILGDHQGDAIPLHGCQDCVGPAHQVDPKGDEMDMHRPGAAEYGPMTGITPETIRPRNDGRDCTLLEIAWTFGAHLWTATTTDPADWVYLFQLTGRDARPRSRDLDQTTRLYLQSEGPTKSLAWRGKCLGHKVEISINRKNRQCSATGVVESKRHFTPEERYLPFTMDEMNLAYDQTFCVSPKDVTVGTMPIIFPRWEDFNPAIRSVELIADSSDFDVSHIVWYLKADEWAASTNSHRDMDNLKGKGRHYICTVSSRSEATTVCIRVKDGSPDMPYDLGRKAIVCIDRRHWKCYMWRVDTFDGYAGNIPGPEKRVAFPIGVLNGLINAEITRRSSEAPTPTHVSKPTTMDITVEITDEQPRSSVASFLPLPPRHYPQHICEHCGEELFILGQHHIDDKTIGYLDNEHQIKKTCCYLTKRPSIRTYEPSGYTQVRVSRGRFIESGDTINLCEMAFVLGAEFWAYDTVDPSYIAYDCSNRRDTYTVKDLGHAIVFLKAGEGKSLVYKGQLFGPRAILVVNRSKGLCLVSGMPHFAKGNSLKDGVRHYSVTIDELGAVYNSAVHGYLGPAEETSATTGQITNHAVPRVSEQDIASPHLVSPGVPLGSNHLMPGYTQGKCCIWCQAAVKDYVPTLCGMCASVHDGLPMTTGGRYNKPYQRPSRAQFEAQEGHFLQRQGIEKYTPCTDQEDCGIQEIALVLGAECVRDPDRNSRNIGYLWCESGNIMSWDTHCGDRVTVSFDTPTRRVCQLEFRLPGRARREAVSVVYVTADAMNKAYHDILDRYKAGQGYPRRTQALFEAHTPEFTAITPQDRISVTSTPMPEIIASSLGGTHTRSEMIDNTRMRICVWNGPQSASDALSFKRATGDRAVVVVDFVDMSLLSVHLYRLDEKGHEICKHRYGKYGVICASMTTVYTNDVPT